MKIYSVVGARPNFIKVAPLHQAFLRHGIESKIVHTGQHYDTKMSQQFFTQLRLPEPDIYLGIGGGSHAQQTAKIMLAFEEVLCAEKPDLVVVVGDVNSTLACALVAVKLWIPVAHVEAGLRSGDLTMPEEINRLVTDRISNYLFVTEPSGLKHLQTEGVAADKVFWVGNVMIDSLIHFREKAKQQNMTQRLGIVAQNFILVTMHRPANVDHLAGLEQILEILDQLATVQPVIFPMHPRTDKRFHEHQLQRRLQQIKNLIIVEPLGYLEFLDLMSQASVVVTDSGGIQEETTYLQIPCLTLRQSTERPVTVDIGTNQLLPMEPQAIMQTVHQIMKGHGKKGQIPELWDGNAAERIAEILKKEWAQIAQSRAN